MHYSYGAGFLGSKWLVESIKSPLPWGRTGAWLGGYGVPITPEVNAQVRCWRGVKLAYRTPGALKLGYSCRLFFSHAHFRSNAIFKTTTPNLLGGHFSNNFVLELPDNS